MKICQLLFLSVLISNAPACGQAARNDLYNCEGCEAIYEHDFDNLSWRTIIPPADEPGERLVLTGTVYHLDGKTPAPNVVVYAYHTNAEGVYPRGDETGWGVRHGYLRGWVKTDDRGRYAFDTIRPAQYPIGTIEAHIHMTIKEPNHREYWIDEVVFEDDSHIDAAYRQKTENRGGSGIIALTEDEAGIWRGTRDIILERHPAE